MLALHLRGDAFSQEAKARDFAYYETLTVRDSSLSASTQAVIAAEVGHLELAYDYFGEAALIDLDDLEHNTRDGLHIASLAGAWIVAVAGFGGMRDYYGSLTFAPRLPQRLGRLAFGVFFRERRLRVEIDRRGLVIRFATGRRSRSPTTVRSSSYAHEAGDASDPAISITRNPSTAGRAAKRKRRRRGRRDRPASVSRRDLVQVPAISTQRMRAPEAEATDGAHTNDLTVRMAAFSALTSPTPRANGPRDGSTPFPRTAASEPRVVERCRSSDAVSMPKKRRSLLWAPTSSPGKTRSRPRPRSEYVSRSTGQRRADGRGARLPLGHQAAVGTPGRVATGDRLRGVDDRASLVRAGNP